MTRQVLSASRVVCADGATWVAIEAGRIVDVGSGAAPSGADDLGDAILAPGYIDIQINGIGSIDFSHANRLDYKVAEQRLLDHGVTTFVPTLISAPLDTYGNALHDLQDAGAYGVHLEGPFLGGAPGAHNPEHLRSASIDWLSATLARFGGLIRIVTLAPEADLDGKATALLTRAGILVSLGHSTCSFDDARTFATHGARAATHLYNAMSGLHHREPGLVGAALDDDRLTPSLIADLVHVHAAALRVAIARKRNVVLISDAIGIDAPWAASRGVREIDGAPRLPDGTLAGSVLTMDRAVQNCVRIGVDVDRAVEMATEIPAELIGATDRGRVAPGLVADLIALDPNDLSVRTVWKDGVRR